MKRIYLLFFLLALTVTKSFSQSSVDAQQILDQLSSKIKSAKGVSASFVLNQYDKYKHVMGSSKGVVKIKGNKYYLKEDNNQVFCNGIQTWNFDGGSEVTVSKVDNTDTDVLSPQQILSGFNKTDFTYKLISSAGNNYQVLLMPVDKRKSFKQVMLYIKKTTNLVSKASITDKTGNINQLSFSTINLNATIPDSEFSFDAAKHPGVEIINQ